LTNYNTHLIERGNGDDDAPPRWKNRAQQLPQPIDNEAAAGTTRHAVRKQCTATKDYHIIRWLM
jgi:hypothetical protein